VEPADVTHALVTVGEPARYSALRAAIMQRTVCSKRTAQLAIAEACRRGGIVSANGQYRLPL
jgi:hypothetical protein